MTTTRPGGQMAVPFPDQLPTGYEWLPDEPRFEPDRHLALEEPTRLTMLTELGYTSDETAATATSMATSSPFRILSDEGAAVLLDTARRLRAFARPAGDRIERTVRGGCYRSRWLRDLCLSEAVTSHLAAIFGTSIAPHPMAVHLGHLNYEPARIDAAIDRWHHDTLPLDYVMTVSDPGSVPGGRFEYFLGTKAEAAELQAAGRTPPRERVVQPHFAGPGYAIALHGNMVVHRGGPLTEPAERITMVNGYVATDPTLDDQNRTADLITVDDLECLYTEWARYAAWRARQRLDRLIDELEFTSDVDDVTHRLESAISDVGHAVQDMRAGPRQTQHYES